MSAVVLSAPPPRESNTRLLIAGPTLVSVWDVFGIDATHRRLLEGGAEGGREGETNKLQMAKTRIQRSRHSGENRGLFGLPVSLCRRPFAVPVLVSSGVCKQWVPVFRQNGKSLADFRSFGPLDD